MSRLIDRWLPPVRIVHPTLRVLRRQDLRQEPDAVVPHVGICPGGAHKGGPYRNRWTSSGSPTGSGQGAAHMMRWMRSQPGSHVRG